MEITISTLRDYIGSSQHVGSLYFFATKKSFVPDSDLYVGIEDLIAHIGKAGITRIEELDELVRGATGREVDNYFVELAAMSKGRWFITPAFVCQLMVLREYSDAFDLEFLISHGFEPDIAKIVLDANKRNSVKRR